MNGKENVFLCKWQVFIYSIVSTLVLKKDMNQRLASEGSAESQLLDKLRVKMKQYLGPGICT